MPRFDQSFNGLREQNLQETQQLKQRYLDGKNKRVAKTKDKKQTDSIQSSVHVQQKFLKRCIDDQDPGGGPDEPPVKLQCTTQHQGHQPDGGLTKFSVEIVQQLEFTTSSANSQPQQISTNVTVKAHTNTSVKSDVASPKSNPDTPCSKNTVDVTNLAECVKQEPDYEFADLDQCAAALEKDAVVNGVGFGGFGDIMGDDAGDEIMSSDALKDLISDITNCSEFMKEFDFDDKSELVANGLKVEDLKDVNPVTNLDGTKNLNSPLSQNYSPPIFENKSRIPSYPNMDFSKTELSPAAQTLKQMAEQHQQQHKNQMGINFNPKTPTSRSPYPDFPLTDYGSPNSSNFHKNSPGFPQPDTMIKQEMLFQNNDYDNMKRKSAGMYKQQYSPYGSPSANHGSPGYLPGRSNTGNTNGGNNFGAGTPPTPPSGAAGGTTTTLQINQAQQLHISQQTHGGHSIQVSAGQHLHLSGDLKGNVSIATQQGMHFTQHTPSTNSNTSQSSNSNQNQSQGGQNQSQHANPMQTNLNMNNGGNNSMGANLNSGQTTGANMHSPGLSNPNNNGASAMQNGMQNVGMSGGSIVNNGMQPNNNMVMMGLNGMNPQSHLNQQNPLGDSYSLSQSQTINFTQQTLRQRSVNGLNNNMGAANQFGMSANSIGVRQMNPQALEHQKLLQQQQQLLRQQQQQQQQQQHVRPPPPDYKSSAMLQNMQSRFPNASNIRRMPHQTMPPSGPMIMRPQNMYMSQQQHISRGMYRPQSNAMSMEAMPQPGAMEWRHMLMSQQQNASFNQQIRPNFQGFNVNNGNMQMNAMQSQQFRMQRAMVGGTMHSSHGMGQNPVGMGQINSMNQMMHMQQQQSVMQQSNNQMSMNSLHMQQTQSINISNQNLQQSAPQGMNTQLIPNASTNSSSVNSFNQQANDFSLEFLENLPGTDTGPFSEQDLLNSFDNDSGFNLQDIL